MLGSLFGFCWVWAGLDEGGGLGWGIEEGVEGGEVAEGEKREGSMWWMGRRWEIG